MSDDHIIDADGGDEGEVLAAEYVLGVLDAAERRAVERRLSREPALAADVAFWEQRLSGLTDGVARVTPPPDLWSRIDSAIGTETSVNRAQPSLWRSLALWRGLTAASAAVAAASLAALAYTALAPTARSPLMATLGGNSGQPNFVAAVTAQGNSLVIVPAALLTKDPHAYELWLIPSGETRPRSLGLVQPGRPIRLDIPADLAGGVTKNATLAISQEPPGGSPTGQPTGPVIAAGKLMNL